jgi:hypothetical protein
MNVELTAQRYPKMIAELEASQIPSAFILLGGL